MNAVLASANVVTLRPDKDSTPNHRARLLVSQAIVFVNP